MTAQILARDGPTLGGHPRQSARVAATRVTLQRHRVIDTVSGSGGLGHRERFCARRSADGTGNGRVKLRNDAYFEVWE